MQGDDFFQPLAKIIVHISIYSEIPWVPEDFFFKAQGNRMNETLFNHGQFISY